MLVLTALALVALMGATAFSVDIGRLTVHKRNLQAIADAAAIDARFGIGQGATFADADSGVTGLAQASAERNGFDYSQKSNAVNAWVGQAVVNANVEQFCPHQGAQLDGSPLPTPPSCTPITDPSQATAVEVKVSGSIPFLFAPAAGGPASGGASATATYSTVTPPSGSATTTTTTTGGGGTTTTTTPGGGGGPTGLTGARVGSYLASVDPTGGSTLAGALSGLLGCATVTGLCANGTIQALSYNGLASGDVSLGQLAAVLGAGSPDAALTTKITYKQLLSATISALTGNPSDPQVAATLSALRALDTELTGTFSADITLGQLLKLSSPGDASAANAYINVLDLVSGGAEIANGQHFLSAPGLGVTIPATTLVPQLKTLGFINPQPDGVSVGIAAIQAPQTGYGGVGTTVSTAQLAVTATATVTAQIKVSVVGILGLQLANVTLSVPVTFGLAGATGIITSISCGAGTPVTISTAANTSYAYLGNVTIANNAVTPRPPTQLVSLSVLGLTGGATGDASTALAQPSPNQSFPFTGPFDSPSPGVRDLGGPPNNSLDQPSLDPSFNLSLTATGNSAIGIPTTALASAATDISGDLSSSLGPVLQQIGLQLGGADTYNLAYPGSSGVACAGTGGLF